MKRSFGALGFAAILLLLGLAAGAPAAAQPGSFITTVQVTGGLTEPIGITNAGDGSGRLFIVERCGRIRIVTGTTVLATPFLDIGSTGSNLIVCGGEQGLLGLAFHPNYETNGFFYVYYTRRDDPSTTMNNEGGDLVVARYQVSSNPNVANGGSALVLLTLEHSSQGNHNGGHLGFGPDGKLYIGTGDGGGGGDPFENGQNINTLLGKILRIDVDAGSPYAIPAGNPFAGSTPGADEVWHYGLRNPWHFSFDRLTGDLFIGDVGQGAWEEIDFQAAGISGRNYGWDCREGAHNYTDTNGDMNIGCGSVVSVDPILEYDHSLGCSVTGGSVFRNLPLHEMYGDYFFGDFCSGRIWRGVPGGGGTWTRTDVADTAFGISGFGEGETGRLYFTDLFGNTLQWLAPYTFADVGPTAFAWPFIEAIYAAGITAGCGGDNFCPAAQVTRAEMAVFLLRAKYGPAYTPPPATGTVFNDVPATGFAASYIEQLFREGVTAGCGGGNYCPGAFISRAEMAVFLLLTREGSGYIPPSCTTPTFSDMPCSSPFAPWVNEVARRGITGGCGGGNFCPTGSVNRAQMAVFLATAFGLPVP